MEERINDEANRLSTLAARELTPQLRQFLRSRYRLLSGHDDLIQQTLGDLYAFLLERQVPSMPIDELRAITFSILKRRVSDQFRDDVKSLARQTRMQGQTQEDSAPSTERVASYRELLKAVTGFMAALNESDRALLVDEAMGSDRTVPLSAAQRQRLSRVRAQMRALLLERGVSTQDIRGDSHG